MSPLHKAFNEAAKVIPELKDGIKKRKVLAENCASLDAPILKKPYNQLRKLYLELFLNIATDDLLVKCSAQSTAEQRWLLVEPFTWTPVL